MIYEARRTRTLQGRRMKYTVDVVNEDLLDELWINWPEEDEQALPERVRKWLKRRYARLHIRSVYDWTIRKGNTVIYSCLLYTSPSPRD